MTHRHHTARTLACAAGATTAALLLTACGAGHDVGTGTAPVSPAAHRTAAADPATTARQTQFAQIRTEMNQAVSAAGLKGDAVVDLHPGGSLTSTSAKYCLNSLLLLVPNAHAAQVATTLEHAVKASGWTPDAGAGPDTIALDHGDWTITVAHQNAGNDTDPATGKVRTGPMTFFQAKDNSLDCS
ncbi:hypothetical protein [Streptacidiphilus melanogenes]|uniref:hypothetical protein n=1 Tax=Streptacidiphilus melanogenes TaxID=411235 RepID=UPI0005A9C7ED|nr:hypothetical protein [Streptacidiphilus melanogenes]